MALYMYNYVHGMAWYWKVLYYGNDTVYFIQYDSRKVSLTQAEMQKAADAPDISVLFFSAGAKFWAILEILGHFWANLGNFGQFWVIFG